MCFYFYHTTFVGKIVIFILYREYETQIIWKQIVLLKKQTHPKMYMNSVNFSLTFFNLNLNWNSAYVCPSV